MHPPPQFVPFPKRPAQKPPPPVSERCIALSVTITLILLLAIGIPLGIILPHKYVLKLPLTIIVPLYIYPEPGAWDLLVLKSKEQEFLVIINPYNGPGAFPKPNPPFLENFQKLDVFPNVRKIGYINADRGNRPNTTVLSEIETYSGWSGTEGLAVHGIFFDQTPVEDSLENRAYLELVFTAVRNTTGILPPQMIVTNPGTLPNANLTLPSSHGADLTILYEGPFWDAPKHEKMKGKLKEMPGGRENYGYLVHSAPAEMSRPRLMMRGRMWGI
ncbi:hypothetical protein P154DRAFT_504550 [Amniculicola lignicola CBS 123094]|uniref:Uncharacterized protein n=1 Tax=Amniculicola lignicola CBS 123094 TaxID=1392246 RepID=A0A6A5VTJ0_9PLEO|nr:hypothetical protein P154DRAFT_504550 [Amniculicola lignicola CBS 123094]